MKRTLTLVSFLVLGTVAAGAQKLEKINPPALSKPAPGTYTHVVKAGKLLFIAGQTGVDATGKVVGPGMKAQVEQVMNNLLAALKSQGADFSHVTKTTTFVTSISEFRSPEVAAVRAKYVGANPPANTLVQIQQLAESQGISKQQLLVRAAQEYVAREGRLARTLANADRIVRENAGLLDRLGQ